MMTPKEIVDALDRYIIGQDRAKHAVAVALRNRYRRSCLPEEIREEIDLTALSSRREDDQGNKEGWR